MPKITTQPVEKNGKKLFHLVKEFNNGKVLKSLRTFHSKDTAIDYFLETGDAAWVAPEKNTAAVNC